VAAAADALPRRKYQFVAPFPHELPCPTAAGSRWLSPVQKSIQAPESAKPCWAY
jgi:hypothetical protein